MTQEPWSISELQAVNIKVFATNTVGDSPPGSGMVRMPGSPDQILASDVEELSTDSATIEWILLNDGGSSIVETEIHLYKGSRSAEPVAFTVEDGFATTFTLDELSPKTAYFYKIFASNQLFTADESDFFSFSTKGEPDAPSRFKDLVVGSDTITWSWSAPVNDGGSDITGYSVYVTGPSGATIEHEVESSPYTMDADPDELYQAYVTATNAFGESPRSSSVDATTDKREPDVPSAPEATDQTPFSIDLAWEEPAQDGGSEITGYTVSYRAPLQDAVTLEFLDNEATLFDLEPATLYTITVYATNAEGDSAASSALRHSTDKAPPEVPSEVNNVRVSA